MPLSPLPATFYERPVLDVAPDLLGARLVRRLAGASGMPERILGGYIIETEAYQGESDLACHARAGYTPRTAVMYGPPGRAYVYFIYGMHWMLNCVTGPAGMPEAVLIRAILPVMGLDEMARRRGVDGAGRTLPATWTNGPARLCQALGIDGSQNNADLTDPLGTLVIEAGPRVPAEAVRTGPRVGIDRVPEPWRSKPWRFCLTNWQPPEQAGPA